MSENICNCHCGTRIDLDEQLLEEREMWKEKYYCLQKQTRNDIENMKENIYMECADLMQKEFSEKEKNQNKIVNEKSSEIKNMITRIIELQTQIKVVSKEKQIIEHRLANAETESEQKQNEVSLLKGKISKLIRDWELKNESDLINIRKQLNNESRDEIEKLQLEKEHLKHKIKQFEQKYNRIIPQVQKMKNLLSSKCSQVEELSSMMEKQSKQNGDRVDGLKQEVRDMEKMNAKYCKHNKQLIDQIQEVKKELEKCKKITKEVKVEAVYVDRPVEVEKVVEKIVEVEKVVKKYVDNPNSDKMTKIEQENNKLVNELNRLLGQLKQMSDNYKQTVLEYEESMKTYEKNEQLYKRQRQTLAHKLAQQNREIEFLQECVNKGSQKPSEGQKIVVHVKQDGSYQKTVEKVAAKKKK